MKRASIILSIVVVIGVISVSLLMTTSEIQNSVLPAPTNTIIVDEEDEQNYEDRLEWMNSMHNAAPDRNWRKMDRDFSIERSRKMKTSRDLPVPGIWKEVGSNNMAGRTLISTYNSMNGKVLLASDGGQIWKGRIGEDNWISLTDHLHLRGIHFLREISINDLNRILICSGSWNISGFMYSDDEGATWNTTTGLENIENWGYIKRAVMKNDAIHTIYLLSKEWDYDEWYEITRIYKSTDQGVSFEIIQTFDSPTYGSTYRFDLWTAYYEDGEVYMVENSNFNYIDDSDNIVFIDEIPLSQDGRAYLCGYESNGSKKFYLSNRGTSESNFYGSSWDGVDWTFKGSIPEGPFMVNSFTCSLSDPDILYFGGVDCFTSINGAVSWDRVNYWYEYYNSPEDKLHADIPGVNPFWDDEGNEFQLINTDGGIYVSYDHLDNVQNISLSNLRISQYYSTYTCRFNTDFSHAGSQDQGYQKSWFNADSSVINYEQVISGDYGHIVSGDAGASIWMVYPAFAMYCPDINNNNDLTMWNFVGSGFFWMPPLMEDPSDPMSVYLAGGGTNGGSHIYKLTYNGSSISYSELSYDFSDNGNTQISALSYSPVNSAFRYVLTANGDFYYTNNGGFSWAKNEDFTGPGSHYFYGATIVASKIDAGLLYVGGSGYSNDPVFMSEDNGATFIPVSDGLPPTLVYKLVFNNDETLLFAATELGPYVYIVEENMWYDLFEGTVPDQTYWSVDFIPSLNTARFGTYGRGIWDFVSGFEPEASIASNDTIICIANTVDFSDMSEGEPTSWEWHFEGGEPSVSYQKNPVGIYYSESGTYDVGLKVGNYFGTDSITYTNFIVVLLNVGVGQLAVSSMSIYPNPTSGVVNIQFGVKLDRPGNVLVMNAEGRLMHQEKVGRGQQSLKLDLSHFGAGVYYILIEHRNYRDLKKLIVLH